MIKGNKCSWLFLVGFFFLFTNSIFMEVIDLVNFSSLEGG